MGQINLKKTNLPQTPSPGKAGIYIDNTNAPILVLEDGSTIPLGGTTLEQIYIDAITGGASPSSANPFVTLSQLNGITGGINTVLEGGTVQWSGTGLVFNASRAVYIIEGVLYTEDPTQLTLTTADGTDPRRDRFKLTSAGWAFDTGTPAAVPVAPEVDIITEIDRGDVLIPALATTPTITDEDVYFDNTQWTTSSGGTGTFNPDSTADPFSDTKSFEATNVEAGGYMLFTRSADYDISNIDNLGLQIKLKASMNNGRIITAQFLDNSDNPVSNAVALPIVKNDTSGYQFVALSKSQIGFLSTATVVRKLKLTYSGTGGPATYGGFYVDDVLLELGVTNGPSTVFNQDEIDAVKNAASPSGTNPFATMADVSAGSYVEATHRESNTVLFDGDHYTGINAAARSGNVLFDFTGAKLGAVTKMKHSDDSAFTIPAEAVYQFDTTDPVHGIRTDIPNYLYFELVDKTTSAEIVHVHCSHDDGGA